MERSAAGAMAAGFLRLYPDEAARMLDRLPVEETVRLLEGQPAATAVSIIERLTPEIAASVVEQMSEEAGRRILSALEAGRTAALLARLGADAAESRLALLGPAAAREVRALMAYTADSAGRLMDPRATTLHPDATVQDALSRLRATRGRPVQDIYLVDTMGRLVGAVALQEVAIADPEERLERLARGVAASVRATATREDVVETLAARRLTALPVVDFEGRLLGVIQQEGLVKAVQEEASADIQTMVGADKEERALSSVRFAVRRRLPWLQINLATAFLAAAVVGIFEGTIARFTALAVLLPVVAGQSGNTGAQALAVTMRGLALREIRLRHWPRVSLKEMNVSVINGLAVAVVTALGVLLWSRSVGLAFVIGLAMVVSMMAAGLAGAAIPMVLTALGQDPAQSSSIILTTVTDVVGFLSFLGLATLFASLL